MSPTLAYLKCKNQKKRIPELENIIVTDSFYSYCYARNIIKGRWEDGEKSIATDPKYSYWYVRDVIKDKFELCHHTIFNSEYKYVYVNFLKSINYDLKEIGEWLI